ncbi:unnamed protein product [Mytilus edulis]|uniref:Uncharacterized protein n=1 Tax=Mytilus edulis TaxID=6550 RepID=A0A8S3SWE3_MYTED|nr:unnamed protein product [Mytilus edulis]
MEWIIYTLCVVGFLILIALSHFVRSYRKRLSKTIRREDRREDIEIRQERVDQPYPEIYDEIDENLIGVDNSNPLVIPELLSRRAITNDVRTMKINTDQEDSSGYLDPVFSINETESQSSLKESSSSHSSNVDLVIPDYTGYLNPYQPLLKTEQKISDGYEVAIHVHQNSERSSGSVSSEDGSCAYKYSHVYQQLKQDQSANTHVYEKAPIDEKELNKIDKYEKANCRNQVDADRKDIDSSDLLHNEETNKQINKHVLFVCQTKWDDARANTNTFTNADDEGNNDSFENPDKPINKNTNQTFHDEECTKKVPRVDIYNEYLDMKNLTQKDKM